MTSPQIRDELVKALALDLVGPEKGSDHECEVLTQAPSKWYLTGFLVPIEAGESQKMPESSDEGADELEAPGGTDDSQTPEPAAARRAPFPSSIGASLLVPEQARTLAVTARWGDYQPEKEDRTDGVWRRTQREERIQIQLSDVRVRPTEVEVPGSDGLRLVVSVRKVRPVPGPEHLMPLGTRSASMFLVNRRIPATDDLRDTRFAFQAELEIECDADLVARADLAGLGSEDWDDKVADLQYRDACEFGVGHGVATEVLRESQVSPPILTFPLKGGRDPSDACVCRRLRTRWIPVAFVERVEPSSAEGVELSMEALAGADSSESLQVSLRGMVDHYREWIKEQKIPESPEGRLETGQELLRRAELVARRIEEGIDLLSDPVALDAFRLTNRAMARSARQRFGVMKGQDAASVTPPKWRPFQLAFLLMNMPCIADPRREDREIMDLLFFPTGGGKTEAYLGLAAFTLLMRRLRNPGLSSAGVAVLMRYTLRLLTLDQLSRAATLICSLELEREKDPEKLGTWPFEIGLWVGQAATPNRMGKKGDNDPFSARAKTIAFQGDTKKTKPIPLKECPWCGKEFGAGSFVLKPNPDRPANLLVNCSNPRCEFTKGHYLPILSVDEPIYRRLPCFLIATVDKFASMPWTGQVAGLFGKVDRVKDKGEDQGFYGPCDPGVGTRMDKPLLPLDLIIQDELHLISGPLGTLVGLYETAIDELSSRVEGDKKIRPKIVASTATVRRAEEQIQALFNRTQVEVFPVPGPDRRDSFFSRVDPEKDHARMYLGVVGQGRSLKVVLLRVYLALLGAAQKAYLAEGGDRNPHNPADPYMTLLGYFNSLRELGGSRRIIEDEVFTRLSRYGSRKRATEEAGPFADRKIAYEVVELTSRVSTDEVSEAKRKLAQSFSEKDRVDVAIATNMISVGLDITRLGLMVVLGQPKTTAEYIQSTSRVGRDQDRPGLVVTLLNIHRPRDRSHYERFGAYHESFYRSVEATSVTPFSARAMDRGLAGAVVSLARLGNAAMTPAKGATEILQEHTHLESLADLISSRAACHRRGAAAEELEALRLEVRDRVKDLLDSWYTIAKDYQQDGVALQYQNEEGAAQRLLHDFLDPDLKGLPARHKKFRANRSLRDVEPSVNLWVRTLDSFETEESLSPP